MIPMIADSVASPPFHTDSRTQQGFLFMHEYNEEEDIRGRLRLSFLSYVCEVQRA